MEYVCLLRFIWGRASEGLSELVGLDFARHSKKLSVWLPRVIQSVEPFLSSEIDKGARWSLEIADNLESSSFGISCVTADNRVSPWLLFEAGALSKSVSRDNLAPILFGVEIGDLSGNPLSQFQISRFNKEEMFKLISSINKAGGDRSVKADVLASTFDGFWNEFENGILEIIGDDLKHTSTEVIAVASEQATADNLSDASNEETPIFSAFFGKDSKTFSDSLEAFRLTDTYKENEDFWESHIVQRRRDLGIGGTGDEWRALSAAHADWVWPMILLARDAIGAGELSEARALLAKCQEIARPENQSAIDELHLDISVEEGGVFAALQAAGEIIRQGIDDKRAASLFYTLSSHDESSKKPKTKSTVLQFLLREYALRRDPSNKNNRFSQAYAMNDMPGFEKIAYNHYDLLDDDAKERPYVSNNMAVIAGSNNKKQAAISLYQKSIDARNPLAYANLSNYLIEAGFLKQAEVLLAGVSDVGDHEENLNASRVKLASATREVENELAAMRDDARGERKKFRAFVSVCIENLKSEDRRSPSSWHSIDGNIIVRMIDATSVDVEANHKKKSYKGRAKWNGLCFEGTLYDPSVSLLSSDPKRMLLVPNRASGLSALFWGLSARGDIRSEVLLGGDKPVELLE